MSRSHGEPPIIAFSLTLLLSTWTAGAPMLRGDRLPRELIDLLPEHTVGVVAINLRELAATDLGKQVLAWSAEDFKSETFPYLPGKDVLRDAERIVIAHCISEKDVNSVCILIQLRTGATVAEALESRSSKSECKPKTIGKHKVYSLDRDLVAFALPDPRTLMLVICLGDDDQSAAAQRAAYGERKTPGPNPDLRRLLERDRPAGFPIHFAGAHPTKASHAAGQLLFWGAGIAGQKINPIGAGLHAYVGGICFGDAITGRIRFAAKDEDVAKDLLEKCHGSLKEGIEPRWKTAAQLSFEFLLDGKELTMELRLEPAGSKSK